MFHAIAICPRRFSIWSWVLCGWWFALGTICSAQAPVGSPVVFDDYFVDKALRLEMLQSGDAQQQKMTLQELFEEPVWPENPQHLLTPFEYGRYLLKVYDAMSNRLIYSRGFDTMFAEYSTTGPALKGVSRAFETTIRCPLPKATIRVEIDYRNKENHLETIFTHTIDPSDYHIRRESVQLTDECFEVQKTGDPHERVDLVFLAEGYTALERDKFKRDAERMAQCLFQTKPYQELQDRFNIHGVFRPSAESGTDQPRQRSYKSTALNSTYNIFDLDRYLLVEDNRAMHRMAAQVPYDTIVVLVNTPRYGGGSICMDYCITSVDDRSSPQVFVHEFGHSFAYLADEYIGEVSYNDWHPPGVEPVEPNITREIDRNKIKWRAFLSPQVELPTVQTDHDPNLVGAFEGGGYVAKGMYRPQKRCLMGNVGADDTFCVVCRDAIQRMVAHYAGEK